MLSQNLFLEKTIENWLSSTNEIGYQLPFCQLLLCEGYAIHHISKHNAFEQGKDVIATDSEGFPCAFQLKSGNITHTKWGEILPEIEELLDLAIIHPSIDRKKGHKSYLVTNGILEDTVRLAIDNLNSNKWKKNPLNLIIGGELLQKFLEFSGHFIPQEVADYKSFLELFFSDGKELLNEVLYIPFIREVLKPDDDSLSKAERSRNIASAVFYTSYIISSFKKERNHISIIQTLTLLCANIFALVEKHKLDGRFWLNSFKIIWKEIKNTGDMLEKEIENGGFDQLVTSIWDSQLVQCRRHLATSYLLAFKLAQLIEGDKEWNTIARKEFFEKLKGSILIWGEASLYTHILLFFYFKILSGDAIGAFKPLQTALKAIIDYNGRKGKFGLISPYYDITTSIKLKFGLLDAPIDEIFTERSFIIGALIALYVLYNQRTELEEYWREITYIEQEKFVPDNLWEHFVWRCETGETKIEHPKHTQSWKELSDNVNKIDMDLIPKTIQQHPYYLPLFLLVYSHRISDNYITFLDRLVNIAQK